MLTLAWKILVIEAVLVQILVAQATGGQGPLRFEIYCSRTTPSDSQVELQWAVAPQGTRSAEVNATALQQVLDITTYKEGFERGRYKTVRPGAPSPEFRSFNAERGSEIPGLQKLKLSKFATSQEGPQQGLRMLERPLSGQESAVAKLEGLEPGMRYFVRISSPNLAHPTVSFTAAVCPVDFVKPQKPR